MASGKYISDLTTSSTQRGLEAKETEIDTDSAAASAQLHSESQGAGDAAAPPLLDTGSYFQVVVEKHRREGRVPVASSPLAGARAADAGPRSPSHPVLFACHNCGACRVAAPPAPAPSGPDWRRCTTAPLCGDELQGLVREVQKDKPGKVFGSMNGESDRDEGPDRVEVYRFERGCGEWLRTAGGARDAACTRAVRRPARAARAALAEALALVGLVVRAPLAALLLVQRCALEVVRDALGGCARNVSDYALKPALAAAFNAAAHPVLVCAANAGHTLRAAAAPFAGLALDALEPLVRVLGAVRLVEVHVHAPPHRPM